MNKLLPIIVVLALPGVAAAYTGLVWGAHSQVLASVSISNSGSVTSVTSSSASSGGNSVGSGGTVTTGEASASSNSEVHTEGGGTVHIKTEAEANGEKKSEEIHTTLEDGETLHVEVSANANTSAKTKSGNKVESISIKQTAQATTSESSDSSTATSTLQFDVETVTEVTDEKVSFVQNIFASLSATLQSAFSWFRFW